MLPRYLSLWSPLPTLFSALLWGCSSNCTPIDDGGVLVDVAGVADCGRLKASASDGMTELLLDTWGTSESDAGKVCSFIGLRGHTGTFNVTLLLDDEPAASQSVTLERADACNISSQYLKFEVTDS